jgi:hypothetical protein
VALAVDTSRAASQPGATFRHMPRGITVEHRPATADQPPLELRRSTRRRRTATAYAQDGVVVVQLPAGLEPREEEHLVTRLVRKVTGAHRAASLGGDAALARRAARLADDYLDGVRPTAVRWSRRMDRRHGSCTPGSGTIRISERLATYPAYVLDYVLVHELAHLHHADHSPAFWELVARYPQAQRARGFLEGVAHGSALPPSDGQAGDPADLRTNA